MKEYAHTGVPKGFPIALWKPSADKDLYKWFLFCKKRICACRRTKEFSDTGAVKFQSAEPEWLSALKLTVVTLGVIVLETVGVAAHILEVFFCFPAKQFFGF